MATAIGYTTTLKLGAATLATVVSIDGPKLEVDSIDTTHLSSTAAYRTFIAGMIDPGEVSCEIQYDKTQQATLLSNLAARAASTWTITSPDSSTWVFSGFIKNLENNYTIDDVMMSNITLQISGQSVFTAG